MQAKSANFKTIIEGNEIPVSVTVTIDSDDTLISTDFTAAIVSVDVNRSLTTSLPANTSFITGYPTAQTTLVLSGILHGRNTDPSLLGMTANDYFNPWNPNSPLYRKTFKGLNVVVQAGIKFKDVVTPELKTIFTGSTDTLNVDHVQRTVTFTCLDYNNKLKTTPEFTPISDPYDTPDLYLQSGRPGLKSTWIMDTLLRSNGIDPTPPPRTGCIYYNSMQGSIFPQIFNKSGYPVGCNIDIAFSGTGGFGTVGPPMQFADGFFNTEVIAGGSIFAPITLQTSASSGFFVEFWMNTDPALAQTDQSVGTPGTVNMVELINQDSAGNLINGYEVELDYSSGWLLSCLWPLSIIGSTPDAVSAPALNVAGWHQIGIQLNVSGAVARTRLYVDTTLVIDHSQTFSTTIPPLNVNTIDTIIFQPTEAFQLTTETAAVPFNTSTWVQKAFLDRSLNNLTATIDVGGQSPPQVIQDLCEAERGFAQFDELGIFRFVNRNTMANIASGRTFQSKSSLLTLQTEVSLSMLANHIIVPVNTLVKSAYQAIWADAAPGHYLPPRTSASLTVVTSDPCVSVSALCGPIPSGGISATNPQSGYRGCTTIDGTGSEIQNVVMTLLPVNATTYIIELTNPNNFTVYLVSPSTYTDVATGTPMLQIGGELVLTTAEAGGTTTSTAQQVESEWPPVSEGGAASNSDGEIVLQIAANSWRQNVSDAQAFSDDLLTDFYKARPLIKNMSMMADPSQQLTDVGTIVDPDSSQLNDPVMIIGIDTSISATAYVQTIDAQVLSTPGAWLMGVVGRSEMGVATYV